MLAERYAWQDKVWAQLMQRGQQLPHAILLHGQAGIGKMAFAQALTAAMLCHNRHEDGTACGECQSCHWLSEGAHPDLKWLQPNLQEGKATKNKPLKRKQYIVIDQVRALADFIHLSSHQQGKKRIVLISPADTLNQAAANALLKILEEPAGEAMFILVTDQLQRLLPTVLSRCVKMPMPLPSQTEATAWLSTQETEQASDLLAYYGGAPLLVVEGHMDHASLTAIWRLLAQGASLAPDELANKLTYPSVEQGIIVLQKWLYDLGLFVQTEQLHYHPSQQKIFARLSQHCALARLQQLQKNVESLRKLASHPLNHALQLEALLLEYTQLFK